ncbi:hypothetical protein BH23CHL8_BH23CHL8_23240 [soil metagenome]
MSSPAQLPGHLGDERSGGSRLENMSTRPSTVVTHRGCTGRQLVPSLRVGLDARRTKVAREHPLRAIGMRSEESAEPLEQARIVERLCRAIIADLRLPGVIPLALDGKLPDEESRSEPLLALVVMTRCSGQVWLRDRAAALERLASGRLVRILLQPDLFRHVLERLDTPGWEAEVFARAEGSQGWR